MRGGWMYEGIVLSLGNAICDFHDDVEWLIHHAAQRVGPSAVSSLHLFQELSVVVKKDVVDICRGCRC